MARGARRRDLPAATTRAWVVPPPALWAIDPWRRNRACPRRPGLHGVERPDRGRSLTRVRRGIDRGHNVEASSVPAVGRGGAWKTHLTTLLSKEHILEGRRFRRLELGRLGGPATPASPQLRKPYQGSGVWVLLVLFVHETVSVAARSLWASRPLDPVQTVRAVLVQSSAGSHRGGGRLVRLPGSLRAVRHRAGFRLTSTKERPPRDIGARSHTRASSPRTVRRLPPVPALRCRPAPGARRPR